MSEYSSQKNPEDRIIEAQEFLQYIRLTLDCNHIHYNDFKLHVKLKLAESNDTDTVEHGPLVQGKTYIVSNSSLSSGDTLLFHKDLERAGFTIIGETIQFTPSEKTNRIFKNSYKQKSEELDKEIDEIQAKDLILREKEALLKDFEIELMKQLEPSQSIWQKFASLFETFWQSISIGITSTPKEAITAESPKLPANCEVTTSSTINTDAKLEQSDEEIEKLLLDVQNELQSTTDRTNTTSMPQNSGILLNRTNSHTHR